MTLKSAFPRFLRLLGAAIALLGAIGAPTAPAGAGPEQRLQDIERRRAKIEARLEQAEQRGSALSSRIRVLDDKRARVEARVRSLDDRLEALDARLDKVRAELTRAQAELARLYSELDEIRRRLDWRVEVFEQRAVAAYQAGPAAAIEGLLSAESFSDLVDRYTYYESALEVDSRLVREIEALERATENKTEAAERKRDEIAEHKLTLERDRAALAQVRGKRAAVLAARRSIVSQKKDLLSRVTARRDRLRALSEQLARESAHIQLLLSGFSGRVPSGGGQLLWPVSGPVTSDFGWRTSPISHTREFHAGIDIAAPYGARVHAADDGVVVFVGAMSGYGNVVAVDHGGGLATTYNHLSASYVAEGERVARGASIAAVGCTGYCTGPHLHFEVRINGRPVDPLPYLQ